MPQQPRIMLFITLIVGIEFYLTYRSRLLSSGTWCRMSWRTGMSVSEGPTASIFSAEEAVGSSEMYLPAMLLSFQNVVILQFTFIRTSVLTQNQSHVIAFPILLHLMHFDWTIDKLLQFNDQLSDIIYTIQPSPEHVAWCSAITEYTNERPFQSAGVFQRYRAKHQIFLPADTRYGPLCSELWNYITDMSCTSYVMGSHICLL